MLSRFWTVIELSLEKNGGCSLVPTQQKTSVKELKVCHYIKYKFGNIILTGNKSYGLFIKAPICRENQWKLNCSLGEGKS